MTIRPALVLALAVAVGGCALRPRRAPRVEPPVLELPARGTVLVVVSAADRIVLADGRPVATGIYLNELTEPWALLERAGYAIRFASPGGRAPTIDRESLSGIFWPSPAARDEALRRVAHTEGLRHPIALSAIDDAGLADCVGLFVPGGHGPMVDLAFDPDMARILAHFHAAGKPTGLLCHGPAALLSCARPGRRWPYFGYRMTAVSAVEERAAELLQLGGRVPYRLDRELRRAGASLVVLHDPIAPEHVVVDRELVTGQNPYSAADFGRVLIEILSAHARWGSQRATPFRSAGSWRASAIR